MVFRILPFVFYPIVLYLMSFFGTPLSWYSILAFVFGFFLTGLSEYFMHRVAFHNRKLPRKVKRTISHGHMFHHRYPLAADDLILPLPFTIAISIALLSVYIPIFGTAYVFWYYLGIVASYFLYEFMHFSAHHLPINLPYFKQMREYHLSHHKNRPNSKFMITNPLWDWLFGTHR